MIICVCFEGKFKDKVETLNSVARRKSEPKSQGKSEGNRKDLMIKHRYLNRIVDQRL